MFWYERCFKSLRSSTLPVQTVVVDNASTDNTANYITSNFPEIKLIQSEVNLGFGQGNNQGIRYALENGADYVFLLNQDAWIEQDTIEHLAYLSKKHPEYGILSPLHLNASKTGIEDGLMHYIANYNITSPKLIEDLYFHRLSELYDTNYVNAAAWLLPNKTLEIIGGFDPIFFHYGEDDNYMQRAQFHGLKIGLCPKTTICHDTIKLSHKDKKAQQNTNKNLLVELTNINQPISLKKHIIFFTRKSIINLVKLNFSQARLMIQEALFVTLMRKKILHSYTTNILKGRNWL
jgi:N-acetylglucosaminyl-diphospho-decaprenol L-rhamnosyltransferase